MNWLRKNIRYFVLSLFLLTNGVIIAESSLSGGPSGSRSSLVALILSVFVNKTTPPVNKPYVPVESLSLKDRDLNNINEGMTYYIPRGVTRRILTSVLPEDATDKNVVWSTSDPTIVDVYPGGLLEARSLGDNVIIKATPSNSAKTVSFTVSVHEKVAPPTFDAALDKPTIEKGITTKVNITADEIHYDVRKLKYFSEDENIATVNEYGVVKGVNSGQTNISVSGSDVKMLITVEERKTSLVMASKVFLNMDSVGYVYGKSPFTYSFDVEDVSDPNLTFISSDETIAKVIKEDDNYYIYGAKIKGTATITAYLNADFSVFTSHTIEIKEVIPTKMSLAANKTSVGVGSAITLSVTFESDINVTPPVEVTNRRVIYSVDDESVAHVTAKDLGAEIIGLKEGSVKVTAISHANPSLKEEITLKITATPFINDSNFDNFQLIVRKALGHFTIFFINGILGFLTFYLFLEDKTLWQISVISLAIGLFIASVSEIIQHFIPGRAGAFTDVMINFSGYLSATLLLLLIVNLINKRSIKKDVRT